MKNYFQQFRIILAVCLAVGIATICGMSSAKVRNISFDRSGENITSRLRSQLQGLTRSDTVNITFGKGEFIIDGSVEFLSHVKIKGKGEKSTRIMLRNDGIFKGDYYFGFNGNKGKELSVKISDLSFDMVDHNDIWWDFDTQKLMLKFTHTDGVEIYNMSSHLKNAACTTIDFRVCSNVIIRNCELVNNNNCGTGGILWIRRDNHNVSITNNKIVKYGDDELLAIWEGGDDNKIQKPATGIKENITIANNEVQFVKSKGAQDRICSVQLALYNFGTDKGTHLHWRNIAIENNNFYFDTPIRTWLSIRFNSTDTHENVRVVGNTVTQTSRASFDGNSHSDIEVHDAARGAKQAVEIANNTFYSALTVKDKHGSNGYNHLIIDGAVVDYHDNSLDATSTIINGKTYAPIFLWSRGLGCDLRLTGNTLESLGKLGQLAGGDGIEAVKITARDNTFGGDTRIFCRGLQRADLDFQKNIFNSTSYEAFLQEFAKTGTLTFKDNVVNVSYPKGGVLFAHYDKSFDISSMRFEKLEIGGNRLRGVSSRQWLPQGMNVGKKKLSRDYYE